MVEFENVISRFAKMYQTGTGGPRAVTPEQDAEIATLYVEGWSSSRLASKFGTSPTSIFASLRRTGTPSRKTGRPKGSKRARYVRKNALRVLPFYELYRWWDNDTFALLYIGHAYAAIARAQSHSQISDWYWKYRNKSMTIQTFETYEQLLEAERLAISNEKPMYNVLGQS